MRTLSIYLYYIISSLVLNASVIDDRANLFTPSDRAQIETCIASSDSFVYVRTYKSFPNTLRSEADSLLAQTTKKGFAIFISLEPREWRISQIPSNLIDPDEIKNIGKGELVPKLHSGDYVAGIKATIKYLNQASHGHHYISSFQSMISRYWPFGFVIFIIIWIFSRFSKNRDQDSSDWSNRSDNSSSSSSDSSGAGGSW